MSTSDSNYDELNNEFDDFANADAETPVDNQAEDNSAYTDSGEFTDPNDYTDSGEYAEADSTEYSDADSSEYSDDSSEYSSDAYAPLEGVDEYSDGVYQSDEPVEEERQEMYHPPVMNRYNVILLITLLILITGIVLVLIRLADYKFNVKAKQTDSGFASVERVLPMSDVTVPVFKNV
ncbi:MAG: hypothetical protein IJF84_04535 [Thermoguttaceae bacterium]|nr:hypothetical protein [Thermoguttaceae bacterium]